MDRLIGRTKFAEAEDVAVLEDEGARVVLRGDCLPTDVLVTGVSLAVRGAAAPGGDHFVVQVSSIYSMTRRTAQVYDSPGFCLCVSQRVHPTRVAEIDAVTRQLRLTTIQCSSWSVCLIAPHACTTSAQLHTATQAASLSPLRKCCLMVAGGQVRRPGSAEAAEASPRAPQVRGTSQRAGRGG